MLKREEKFIISNLVSLTETLLEGTMKNMKHVDGWGCGRWLWVRQII